MSWDFKYVSAACPELTKAEVEVLIDHLHSDSRYDSATASSIQELARQIFPDIYRHREAVTNQHVREAIELIERRQVFWRGCQTKLTRWRGQSLKLETM